MELVSTSAIDIISSPVPSQWWCAHASTSLAVWFWFRMCCCIADFAVIHGNLSSACVHLVLRSRSKDLTGSHIFGEPRQLFPADPIIPYLYMVDLVI
jgi:hypothetical protein